MPDDKPPMPPQPKTVDMPAVKVPSSQLDEVLDIVKTTAAEVRVIRYDQDLLIGTVESLKVDVRDLQRWKLDTEDRQTKHSGGIARVSTNDAKQDSTIADLVVKVDALTKTQETQLAILTRLDAVAANPMVRRVAYAIGAAVLTYLTAKGALAR